jgi:hypothetical protein
VVVTTVVMHKNTKEGRRDGTGRGGGRSVHYAKNGRGGGCQATCEREERGGVTGGGRGDRRAEERQKAECRADAPDGTKGEVDAPRPRPNGQEGEMCSVRKEAKELRLSELPSRA